MKLSETGIPGVWVRRYPTGRQRYGFTIVWNGETYRRASRVNTLRGATVARARAGERLAAGLPIDERPANPPLTVAKAVSDYLSACEGQRSLPTMRIHARDLIEFLGELPVTGLSQVAIAGFRKGRSERGVSVATVNRALSFLRAALNHSKGEGRFEGEHYFERLFKADRRKVFLPEAPSAGLRRVSDTDFESVVGRLPQSCRSMIRLLLATAARKGEIAGLRWGEVRGDTIYLRRTKSGKPRWIPLSSEAIRLLPERPSNATDDDLVFRGREGGAVGNNLDRAWRAAREQAGLRWLRIHDLRHEAASRFLESGGTLRELQVLGGWSSLELVERYSKADRERIRQTLARMPLPSAECAVSAPMPLAPVVGLAK
jgi:integrase